MTRQANLYWQDGEKAAARRDWPSALRAYGAALACDPRHVPSMLGLSSVHIRLGHHRDAQELVMQAHAAGPRVAPLIFAVGQRLRYFNEYQAVIDCFGIAEFAEQAPSQPLAEAAVSLSTMGANQPAMALIERALRRDAMHAGALYFRGNLHTFNGNFDAAEQDYEAALRSDPRLFQSSWMLAGLRKQTSQSNHVERLHEQLKQVTPGRRGEVYVSYAMHKELHDLGEHRQAWTALERGCNAERSLVRYDPVATTEMFAELTRICNADFCSAVSTIAQETTPIFIVGMFRSGTSLIERMLSGHSAVTDGGETLAFTEQMKRATDRAMSGVLNAEIVRRAAHVDFDEVARGYATPARWLAKGRPFFTEKLPSNFLHIGFIAKALPHARIVHLVRDPMDTCFANMRTLFSEVAAYSYDQREMADYYNQYRLLMRHWHSEMPGRVLDVAYSDLVNDPAGQMRRIADYCGLPFEEGMLDLARIGGSVVTASAAQVRQGIVKDRGAAWLPYAQQLQVLRAALDAGP